MYLGYVLALLMNYFTIKKKKVAPILGGATFHH
jgi:hypothetical protein